MEQKLFGCEELDAAALTDIQGGGYVNNILTLAKAAYSLTKGFALNVPLAGPLAVSLLTSFVDPVIDAA